MATKKKRTNGAIDALRVEIAQPHISSSALKAMGSKTKTPQRKLEFIGYFYGYQCSRCRCRFPETALPKGASITGRIAKRQCQTEFAEHVCSVTE
jgi:hypothetical protein